MSRRTYRLNPNHEKLGGSIQAAMKHSGVGNEKYCLLVFDAPPFGGANIMNYAANVPEGDVIAALREMADRIEQAQGDA